jgi:DNA-binding NarL/FixJ family response regulator
MCPVSGDGDTGAPKRPGGDRPRLRIVGGSSRVVIADSDAARRAALLDELTQTMPEGTIFQEAGTVSEVLEHARDSHLVILGGALQEVPASSLIRILGQRHPGLHVVNLAASERAGP